MPKTQITPLECQFAVPVERGGILFDLNRYIPDASGTLVPQDPPPYSGEEIESISQLLSDGMALPELQFFYQKLLKEEQKKSGNSCLTIPVKVDKILCSQKNKACFLNEGTLVYDGLTLDPGTLARTLSELLPPPKADETSVLTYQLPQGQVVFDLTPYQKNEQGDLVPAPLTAYDVWQRDQVKKDLDRYFATDEGQQLYQQIFQALTPQDARPRQTTKIRVPLKIDFSQKRQGVLGSYKDRSIVLASPTLDLETFHHESIHFLQDALYPGLLNRQNYPYEASFAETGLMIETEAALKSLWFATDLGDKTSDKWADCQVIQGLKDQFSKTISDPTLLKKTVLRTYFRDHLLTGSWVELYSQQYQRGALISEIIRYRDKGDKCPDEILNAQAHMRQNLKNLGLEESDLETLTKMGDKVRDTVMERKRAHEEEHKAMGLYFPTTLGKIKGLSFPKVPEEPQYIHPQESREK